MEDATDIFQDTMVCLYENVVSEKLEVMSSTFKTYVFSIGKNLLSNFQKKSKAIIVEENTWDNDYVSHVTEHFEYAKTEKEGVLMRMIASLGLSLQRNFRAILL